MTGFKDRFSVGLPRTAVIIHDLCMVWFAWTGLHQFAMPSKPCAHPAAWSMTTAIVLVALGLVLCRSACIAASGDSPACGICSTS